MPRSSLAVVAAVVSLLPLTMLSEVAATASGRPETLVIAATRPDAPAPTAEQRHAPKQARTQIQRGVPDTVPPREYAGLPQLNARPGVPSRVKVLVMRVHWNGAPPKFPDTGQMRTLMKKTATWFARVSRGRHHLSSKVTPWLRIGGGVSNCSDYTGSTNRAVRAARGRGANIGAFNRFMIVMPQCGSNSSGEMPGRVTWIREGTTYVDVLTHELGHNLGLAHANSLICQSGKQRLTQAGKCASQEYGDLWDAMGLSSRSYSVPILQRLGWAGKVATAKGSGTWKLTDSEAGGKGLQGLRVRINRKLSYWVEYRTNPVASEDEPGTFGIIGTPGVQIRLDNGKKSMRLLDAAPGNPDSSLIFPDPDMVNAALPAGSSFTTPQKVRITVLSQDATRATVRVTRKSTPKAPQAPVVQSVIVGDASLGMADLTVRTDDDGGQVVLGYEVTEAGGKPHFVAHPGSGVVKISIENSAGPGTWSVRAVNQVGTSAASASVAEHVAAPVITATSPAAGGVVQGPTFTIAVNAAPDPITGSPVSQVQVCSSVSYYSCQSDSTAPFSVVLTSGAGARTLAISAYDADGNTGMVSVPITVLESPPSVRIDSPANGASFGPGTTVAVGATAVSSPYSGLPILGVDFAAYDSAGQWVFSSWDDTAPYTADMSGLTGAGPNAYRIEAIARDDQYSSAPASITITVN